MVADKVRVSGIKKPTRGWALTSLKKLSVKAPDPRGVSSKFLGFSTKRVVKVPIMPSLIPKSVNKGTKKATREKIEQMENK
jgi:hypothetical protein